MKLKYTECPRDSWQGLTKQIPTEEKIRYIQSLIDAGFKDIDMGSFVSPKAVPQLADTEEVLSRLSPQRDSRLLAIIANLRGLERALQAKNLTVVAYPLSVNERFQKQNTNKSITQSWDLLKEMQEMLKGEKLELLVHLSMGFGNPYGDSWKAIDTARAHSKLREIGVERISLADTVGKADIRVLESVLKEVEEVQNVGLHMHAKANAWQPLITKALEYDISHFEGAMAGIGGCPFAEDELLGNLPSEKLLAFLAKKFELDIALNELPSIADKAASIAVRYS